MAEKTRVYLAIDLKSFYASVECVGRGLDPLSANLVVADESRTDKTICLAVSPALKAYGIPGRPRLFEVKQRLAQIERATGKKIPFVIARPRMAKYMEISRQIFGIYMKYAAPEDMHVYSVDEVFMDVSDYRNVWRQTPRELVSTIIQDVLYTTGITATAGIGTNLYLAKIAMDIGAKHINADENGVRIAELNERSYRELLWDHKPITDFWRIGRGTARRLAEHRLFTMGDIARESLRNEEWFYREFGVDAELLIDHAWGIEPTLMSDIKCYEPETNSLSSGQVLSCPYPFEKARIIIDEMTDLLILELVEKGLVAHSFSLDVGYDREAVDRGNYEGTTHIDRYGRRIPDGAHGSVRFDNHTSSTKTILPAVLELYDRIVDKDLTVRRMNVTANDVIREADAVYQMNFFSDSEASAQEKNLQKAMLEIKGRFGKNAVLRGTNLLEGATARERNQEIGGHRA